jgi:hypothetical protein
MHSRRMGHHGRVQLRRMEPPRDLFASFPSVGRQLRLLGSHGFVMMVEKMRASSNSSSGKGAIRVRLVLNDTVRTVALGSPQLVHGGKSTPKYLGLLRQMRHGRQLQMRCYRNARPPSTRARFGCLLLHAALEARRSMTDRSFCRSP